MVISAETVPPSPPNPLPPPVSFAPPSRRRVSFQSTLHNFDFPILKTWGSHQVLRCLNINRKGEIISGNRRSDLIGASANSPEQIRPENNHISIDSEPDHLSGAPNSPSDVTRPWNLRTRKVPINRLLGSGACPSPLPPKVEKRRAQARTVRLRSESLERREHWPKIEIHLTLEEIEEDIYALTGSRPRRRPRKRPRIVQRKLDLLVPGSWLPSISPNTYRVPDLG